MIEARKRFWEQHREWMKAHWRIVKGRKAEGQSGVTAKRSASTFMQHVGMAKREEQ